MNDILSIYLSTSLLLIILGFYCISSKRNMIKTIIGIEIITSAINLNFITLGFSKNGVDYFAQSIAIISISIAACIAAVALSLILNAYRHYGSIDLRKLRRLRW
jgi:multicomponent Na+:H+ antiporter subunit C